MYGTESLHTVAPRSGARDKKGTDKEIRADKKTDHLQSITRKTTARKKIRRRPARLETGNQKTPPPNSQPSNTRSNGSPAKECVYKMSLESYRREERISLSTVKKEKVCRLAAVASCGEPLSSAVRRKKICAV
ncbi:MAG: hypothetical protein LBH77_10620 [Tannerella sp.]|jgi:hypothetical protein|nr:hypothetical protein [Tannerella sp.]